MDISLCRKSIADNGKRILEKISVIIPITERHDDLSEMIDEYKGALSGMNTPHEMIFVVDGVFVKGYWDLKSLKERGENLTIIKLAKAYGESSAIMAGFRVATGNVILIAPPYHQVDPAGLTKLVETLNGFDMVIVRRWPRIDSRLNQLQTNMFHRIASFLTGEVASDLGCGVRLFRREVLEEITLYGELHRFLPILAHRQGFKIKEIDIGQSPKEKRLRTYSFGTYLRRLIDLITVFFLVKFTKKPLRFFGLTGTAVLMIGMIITSYLVIGRVFLGMALSDRPLFLIGILFLVLGLQIFAIGLIGEIIIFTHAKDIKEYKVQEIIN